MARSEINWSEKLKELKQEMANAENPSAELAIVWEVTQRRIKSFTAKFVPISEALEAQLVAVLTDTIDQMHAVEAYTIDSHTPDAQNVLGIDSIETNIDAILEGLDDLAIDNRLIKSYEELSKASGYLIMLRVDTHVMFIGYRKIPENWKLKRKKGVLSIFYKDGLLDLESDQEPFSISDRVGIVVYDGWAFVNSFHDLEVGLKIRDRIEGKAEAFYQEIEQMELFENHALLKNHIGNNVRFLKQFVKIKELGHYNNATFIANLRAVSATRNWGIQFNGDKIVLSEATIKDVVTVLQDKRLLSELTSKVFDVGTSTEFRGISN